MTRRSTVARPLEVALKLQERLAGAAGWPDGEPTFPALAKKLAHSFPCSPSAHVALGTLLCARLLHGGSEPSTHAQRSCIIQACSLALSAA